MLLAAGDTRSDSVVRGIAYLLKTQHKDGSWRIAESLGHILALDAGQAGMVVNVRDITEQQIEAEMQKVIDENQPFVRREVPRAVLVGVALVEQRAPAGGRGWRRRGRARRCASGQERAGPR